MDAESGSQRLISAALDQVRQETQPVTALDVFNTCSWPRTELVVVPDSLPVAGDLVKTTAGEVVPSQRLASGQLAFLARDVPPLGARRFLVAPGEAQAVGHAKCESNSLDSGAIRVSVDPDSGGIRELVCPGISSATWRATATAPG